LFIDADENEAYENALSNNKKIEVNENQLRSIFKTCSYGFYPLIRLMAAIVSMECVKRTGKYTPLPTPYFINWYDKISFEIKKKIEGQYYNIIETDIVDKMSKMQVGIIDDGAQSLELFNVLFSCQIAESRKLLIFGLETLE
jgi:3-deoxy-D-arabino-heptulosonate 7-phosphate (DAHP) synthase